MKKWRLYISLFALLPSLHAQSSPQHSSQIGPERGWLVLHGGGNKKEYEAMKRFVSLAGGQQAAIVVVLTPIPQNIVTPEFMADYKRWWGDELGAANVTMIDTRNRQEAETETFVSPIRKASGVWITGGEHSNLIDAYLGTKTEQEIKAVADRGGVVGGSSAGAMILGSFQVSRMRPSPEVPWRRGLMLNTSMLVGFGLLKGVAVDPHFFARHREKDMLEIVSQYPDVIGIGIDEETAIVVHGDQFEVIGEGRVGVFEIRNRSGKKFIALTKGQKFDLKQRIVIN